LPTRYEAMGRALHALVERPKARRSPRNWLSLKGKPRRDNFTALQWWYYNFCFLRNDLAHGQRVKRSAWRWKGEHHLVKAEHELRRAMRADLVRLGDDSLLALPYTERDKARFNARVRAAIERHLA
jgi:hypothetical protein